MNPSSDAMPFQAKSVLDRLSELLNGKRIPFDRMEHEAVFTSEQAARIRGTALSSGAKALICKADDEFRLFVIPADRRLANKLIRKHLGSRQLRFATPDEVFLLTGLRPGSIPPFGSLFALKTYCDQQLAGEPRINFNAGDHCVSFSMAFADYQLAEGPELGGFAE